MRRTNAATTNKSDRAPASQTRPKAIVSTRPEPMDEPLPDFAAALDAAALADEYDSIRVKQAEFDAEEKRIKEQLIAAMKAAHKEHFNTMHGRVSLLKATESKEVPDEKAAVALLAKHGIPQPPTMAEWLARHRDSEGKPLQMPMTTKEGMPDRIKFEKND
jgi:hypothetical protein